MILNGYGVKLVDGRTAFVYAQGHTIEEGDLTLHNTANGFHFDVFPSGYWTEAYENGEKLDAGLNAH